MGAVRKSKNTKRNRSTVDRSVLVVVDSMAESDRLDLEYWRRRTPEERMMALEQLRQRNFGYGEGKPRPQFQRVLRVSELRAVERTASGRPKDVADIAALSAITGRSKPPVNRPRRRGRKKS